MRPLIGSEEANRKWRRCIMVLSRHVAPFGRIFTLPLAPSILLLPSQNPSPFLLVPLFSVRLSGGRYFCGHLVPAEPGHASSFFFFLSRGSTCVAKRRSGVARRCEAACDTVHTLSCHIGFRFNVLKRMKVWRIGGRVSGNKLCTSPGVESNI